MLTMIRIRGNVAKASPNDFRPGDLVEVTVEFAAFPAGSNKMAMITILRAIRMVTEEFRNVNIIWLLCVHMANDLSLL